MRISTQYKITIAIFSLVLIVIAASIVLVSESIANTRSQENLANNIARGAGDLAYVSNDFVIYRGSQQLSQWQKGYASFSEDIANLSVNTPEQKILVQDIQVNQQRIETVFDSIVSLSGSSNLNASTLQISWSRMSVQTQAVISDANQLSHLLRAQADQLNFENFLLITGIIGTFAIFLLVIYVQTFRRTLKSLSKLEVGAAVIGSGNLDYTLSEDKIDEIGELSRSFNQMTANLKSVTASKVDLEKEIVQRKKVEEALRKSQQDEQGRRKELEAIIETVPATMWFAHDRECSNMTGNKATYDLLQLPLGANVSETPLENHSLNFVAYSNSKPIHSEDLPLQRAARTGKPVMGVEFELRFADGRRVWLYGNAVPLFNDAGAVQGAIGTFVDVTLTKQVSQKVEEYARNLEGLVAERTKELELSSQYARGLIEASLDPLVTINADGKITDVNKATEIVTGYSRKNLIGSDFSDYFTEPEKARVVYQRVFNEGFVRDYPLAIKHKSGKITDVLYNATIYRNEEGQTQGIFAAARDITERVKLEKQVQDSERLAAIGATAGMVGHDIRNPLQAIISDAYLAKAELETLLDSEQKKMAIESIEEIRKNTEYINKIVQDLQDYARPLNPKIEETDLKQVIDSFIAKNDVPENIKVSIRIAKGAQKIRADSYYLNRILYNLITNSIQAMSKGGKLIVEARKEGEDTILNVQDTGVGIPKNIQDKMFTLMFTTKSKGQGFGLPVVKRMTESLGGTVSFESQEGKGTTFTVCLPSSAPKEINDKLSFK
ncbi:MAG TPA: PAS domain S-box protein [Candidatus Sulfotelmatobacter sp.]|nr:PAS domain S-box protein [Candidatus Sulfotelmatobacter sp.]